MALLDTKKVFGNLKSVDAPAVAEKPKSEFWINVGYTVDVDFKDEQGNKSTESRFIPLPLGIALDAQKKLPTNSSNDEYSAMMSARNALADKLMALAGTLEPGEDRIVKLEVQLRRVKGDREEIPSTENPFIKDLEL